MITVVSGLARSGTSLLMQMLAAGGMPVLTDGQRVPDEHNPRGYYEWEPVKLLAQEPQHIEEAEGKAVKVISPLLSALPAGHEYRIFLMHRPLAEVVASQIEMMRARGTSEASLNPDQLSATLQSHIDNVQEWLHRQSDIRIMTIEYADAVREPAVCAARVCQFLGVDLDREAMASQADPALYRQRKPEAVAS